MDASRSPAERPGSVALGDGAGGHDPLGGLPGDLGDQIEVVVVVEHHETSELGRCRYPQVGGGNRAVLPAFGEEPLNHYGTFLDGLVVSEERRVGEECVRSFRYRW